MISSFFWKFKFYFEFKWKPHFKKLKTNQIDEHYFISSFIILNSEDFTFNWIKFIELELWSLATHVIISRWLYILWLGYMPFTPNLYRLLFTLFCLSIQLYVQCDFQEEFQNDNARNHEVFVSNVTKSWLLNSTAEILIDESSKLIICSNQRHEC